MVLAFASAFKGLAGMLRANPVGTVEIIAADTAVASAAVGVAVTTFKQTAYTVAFGPKNAQALLRT